MPARFLRSPRASAATLAAGRVAVGVAMLGRPVWLGRFLGVDRWTAQQTSWMPRMVGGREVALGLGTLHAIRATGTPQSSGARRWVFAAAFADAVDVAALAAAVRSRQVTAVSGALVAVTAACATGLGLRVAFGRAGSE